MKLQDLRFQAGAYLAFELSSESRAKLLKQFPPKFSKVICHHVTIEFGLKTADRLEEIKQKLGEQPEVKVVGYRAGEGVECLIVQLGSGSSATTDRLDGKTYHITLSVEPPHKPVESNALLAHGFSVMKGTIPVTGAYRLIKV